MQQSGQEAGPGSRLPSPRGHVSSHTVVVVTFLPECSILLSRISTSQADGERAERKDMGIARSHRRPHHLQEEGNLVARAWHARCHVPVTRHPRDAPIRMDGFRRNTEAGSQGAR